MVISTLRHLTSLKYRLHVCMRPTPEPRQCAGWRPRAAPSAWPGSPPECPSGTSYRLCSAALCHLRRSDCNCSAFLLLLLCRYWADTTFLHICPARTQTRWRESNISLQLSAGRLLNEWVRETSTQHHCYQYLHCSFLLRVTVKINYHYDGIWGLRDWCEVLQNIIYIFILINFIVDRVYSYWIEHMSNEHTLFPGPWVGPLVSTVQYSVHCVLSTLNPHNLVFNQSHSFKLRGVQN